MIELKGYRAACWLLSAVTGFRYEFRVIYCGVVTLEVSRRKSTKPVENKAEAEL
jgi:hypothetical protein